MRNINELWDRAAEEFAERVAVSYLDDSYTYSELDGIVRGFAAGLEERLGVKAGDRVALIMPNCLHSIVCYLGCLRMGAIALPVNVRLKAEEMRFILEDAGAEVVVVHRAVWGAVKEALEGMSGVREVVGVGVEVEGVVPVEGFLTPRPPLLRNDAQERGSTATAGGAQVPALQDRPAACPTDTAAIIYTSGTTGLPKGAMITHGNVLFNVQATISGHGFRGDDVHVLVVPLFHVTGLNTIMPTAFHQGARLVVTSRTDPAEQLALVEKHRATTLFGVPTTMILLAQTAEGPDTSPPAAQAARSPAPPDTSSLRLIAYSGAPMPVRAIERLREMFPGVKLHNFFGLTETTSVTSVLEDEQALVRPESIGRAVAGLEVKVVGEDGEALAAGEVGELLVRGPSVVKGYYNRPEATAEAIVGGWLHTGDTAVIDEEGYIFLQGRKKEMIIVAGENVYPVEVENVLTRHPAVAEAAAIGVAHGVLGEVVKAVVVLRPGAEATERELKRHCVERLASYKAPQSFELVEALPRNPSGKVVKRELRGEV